MSKAKRNALLLLSASALLILLLAMSLPRLVLDPGQPFSLGQPQPGATVTNVPVIDGELLILFFRGFLGLILVLLPFYLVYSLVTPQGRRRLLATVVFIVLLLLATTYLQNHPLKRDSQQTAALVGAPKLDTDNGPPTAIFAANPPTWLTLAVILTTSIVVVALIFGAIWFFRRRRPVPDLALEKLAEAAQTTLDSIEAGGDFKVTVIRCYQEMSRVVAEEKGIARETSMTAREFEDRLVSRGLPPASIGTLTRLFEQVRYGSLPTGTREETLAFDCLTEIVTACKVLGGQP